MFATVDHPEYGKFQTVAPPFRMSGHAMPGDAPAPLLAVDTADVLAEAGVDDETIALIVGFVELGEPMAAAAAEADPTTDPERRLDYDLVIVGSGFSGIGAAVELQRRGFHDYVILEKADALGGTWRDATYPGLEVDMPSFIYSYPFAMSAEWDHVYPEGRSAPRLHPRHRRTLRGRRPHPDGLRSPALELGRRGGRLDDGARERERIRSRFLVSASGLLVEPRLPDIPGIETFAGPVVHTGRWDPDVALEGKRVGVIGTGASAIQVVPAIVDEVAALSVFQRTPIWLMSKPDAEISERTKRLFGRLPFLQRLARWALFAIVELTLGPGFIHYKKFPFLVERLERNLVE